MKFIRRGVTEQEKKRIQPRLQQAFSRNGKGFYVHAPKQRGNVKEQLRYIGRYMRRPAIGLNRIEAYDGQMVTFKYVDKTDGKEKTECITAEEFIARLIRHIPEEQFKTIRHYGMYSRRIKNLCKKALATWQETTKRWIVSVKKTLRRKTWRERMIANGRKDPMICPHCESCYEYKGEVCKEHGKLTIKVALCKTTKAYLERVIHYLSSQQTTQKEKEISHIKAKGTHLVCMPALRCRRKDSLLSC